MKSGQMLKIFLAKKTISFLKESLNNSCKASKKISNYLKCSILFQQFTNNIEIKVLPVVNFINTKRTNFLYELHFGSFYYVHVTRKKAAETKFIRKIRT